MVKPSSKTIVVIGALIISVIGLLLYVFVPSVSGLEESKEATKVYFADHISPAHQIVIDRFNELHKGSIEVVAVDLPFSKFSTNERKELLARSLRSRSDCLDMFSVDYVWGPRFAKWSEPLDQYIAMDQRKWILDQALKSCMYEDTLVALPLYIDVGMLYYRRDLLRHLPDGAVVEERLKKSITWDELVRLRTRLGFGKKPFYIFQANDYEGLVCNYFELVEQRDTDFINQRPPDLTRPSARIALKTMVDFVRKECISPPEVTEFDEILSYRYMLDHDAMFVRGWPSFLRNLSKMYGDTAKLANIGRAALPHIAGKKPASVIGGWMVMVSKYSGKKKEAMEFVRFLQTKESQETFYEAGGFLPINAQVYGDSAFMKRFPDLAYYRQLLNNGFQRPSLVDYTRISDIISHYVHVAIKGEIGVNEALQRAAEMIRLNKVLIK